MPVDFGEIASYHLQEAVRYAALAQAVRERGSHGEAEYLAGQAARYAEAAQEQKRGMRQDPGLSIANRRPNRCSPEPRRVPPVPTRLLAVLRGAGDIVASIRQSMPRRNPPINGLSLH